MMMARYAPRILLFFLLLASLGLLIAGLRAARLSTATISLVVPGEPVPAEEPIEIEVRISDAADVGAFEIRLEYDRSLAEIVAVSNGEFLGSTEGCDPEVARCASYLSVLNEESLTSVGAFTYGNGGGRSGDGLLATLQLQPTGTRGVLSLHFKEAILLDVEANDVPVSSQDAALTIGTQEFIYLPFVHN